MAVLAATVAGAWLVTTPRLAVELGGTGDAFSALFLGHYLVTGDLRLALERAVSAMFALVEQTHAARADELHWWRRRTNWSLRRGGCAPGACAKRAG